MEPIKDGRPVQGTYLGLSVPVYESIPALRWSRLSPYLRSAWHGKLAESRADVSDDLTFGQAVHRAVLQPELFDKEFCILPEDAPRRYGKANLEWWAKFEAENKGKDFLKPEMYEEVKAAAVAIYEHPTARRLLTSDQNVREVSVVWMDPEYGLWCKARPDLVSRVGSISTIVDLKTARDASPYGFSRDLGDFSYHSQLAFYRRGLNVVAPYQRGVGFIVIEKKTNAVVVYDLDEPALEVGEREIARALTIYTESKANNSWPSYPDGVIGLPAWRLKE